MELTLQLFEKYAERFKDRSEQYFYGWEVETKSLGLSTEQKPGKLFSRMADKRREEHLASIYESLPVEEVTNNCDEKYPILIEEIYKTK